MISRWTAKVFFGWWLVGASFLIQFLIAGLLNQAYGSYVVLLRGDFGWSKTALSGAYSLQQLQQGLLSPGQGVIMDRVGVRTMMQIGVVVLGVGFILMGFIHSLAAFYATFLVMSIGASLCGFFPGTVAVINWFERKRAKALAVMNMGQALGGIVVPLVALSLEHFGWRHTAQASGVLIIAIGIPMARLMRRRPEDHGEVLDGEAPPAVIPGVAAVLSTDPRRDFTFKEAVRMPVFWFISLGHGSALLVVSAVNVHVVSHLTGDLGYSLGEASLVITLMTAMQLVGMVIGGAMGDKTDNATVATFCMGMHAAGLLLVAYAVAMPMVIGFAVLHGLAWGLRGPLMLAMRADYFGRSAFATISGFSALIWMIGTIAGPLLAGYLADRTGNYEVGFTLLAVMAGLGSIFFILAKKPERPLRDVIEEREIEAVPAAT